MDDYRLPDSARVKLKDGIDPVFYNGLAKVGNEGVISAHRRDKLGYPEVFIKWDREHWAYNQQPDCWTYEGHFELVKEPMEDKERREMFQQAVSGFADQMAKLMGLEETSSETPDKTEERDSEPPFANRKERFKTASERAIELLRQDGVESFVVTVATRRPHPDAEQGEMRMAVVLDSLSPEAELANGAQLASLAAQFHEAAAILQLYTLAEERNKNGSSE